MARAAIVLLLLVGALALRQSAPVRSAPPVERRDGITFTASVDPASRALIESAVTAARPEARAMIEDVAGLVDVRIARPDNGALGTTQRQADGRYDVVLDLGTTQRHVGARGVVRLVLHELGHVVDFELVPRTLAAELDAGIPKGPAARPERFAETFAKWAMGNDLGADLYIGYAVPPPVAGFDAWASRLVSARSAAPGTAGR